MMQFFFVLLFVVIASAAIAGVSAAPWVPTKPSQRRKFIERLPMTGTERVVDLGCGDGSMLFGIARKYPGIHAVGVDISIFPLAIGIVRKWIARLREGTATPFPYGNIQLRFANLWTSDVRDADLVFVFLMQKAYPKLVKKLAVELRDDARVAVEVWPLPGIEATETLKEEGLLPVYIYTGKQFRT